MSLKMKASNVNKFVRPGTYDATLSKVEEATSAKGPYLKWTFTVTYAGHDRTLVGVSPMTLDGGSKTKAWVEALLGRFLKDNEEIDLERLVGRTCRIDVTVNRLDDGRDVNRIERLHKRGGLVLTTKEEDPSEPPEEEGVGVENPF